MNIVAKISRFSVEPDICEISACVCTDRKNIFHKFVLPQKDINEKTKKLNNLSFDGRKLYRHGKQVDAKPRKHAYEAFVQWLEHLQENFQKRIVLVDHFVEYHQDALESALKQFPKKYNRFMSAVEGFSDTCHVFKRIYPHKKCTREKLALKLAPDCKYRKYDAKGHVKILMKIVANEPMVNISILQCNLTRFAQKDLPVPLKHIVKSKKRKQSTQTIGQQKDLDKESHRATGHQKKRKNAAGKTGIANKRAKGRKENAVFNTVGAK